jgi:hypothetical protein
MTTTNAAGSIKAITKIVTFYSDGTFSEYTPSPGSLPPITNPGPYVGPPMNPITPWPAPWWQQTPYWQNPVICQGGGSGTSTSATPNYGPSGSNDNIGCN